MGRLNAALLITVLLVFSDCVFATDTWRNVRKIVAIGDIHGDYEQMRTVPEMSGVIDSTSCNSQRAGCNSLVVPDAAKRRSWICTTILLQS